MSSMVEVKELNYSYGKEKVLNQISLTLETGKIYGLWGRNGAGKTTLMRCISGLSPANEIYVNGSVPYDNEEISPHICFIQENHPLNPLWSVKDAFCIAANFKESWNEALAEKAAAAFHLKLSMKVKKMSKGMKTALALTIGLASRARVTIFDEPTNGLDAAHRETFYDLLMEEHEQRDRLFLISTHYINELHRYIENLLVLKEGALIQDKTMEQFRQSAGFIHGTKEELNWLTGKAYILEKKEMGPLVRYMIDLDTCEDEHVLEKVEDHVHLQDYLLRVTDNK
ncbi:multidrug ABC transporter ATP-binding protein [Salipaludibacillus keqinensis]|uniref:Multidrug ABC transporter ATP-binding protein n=1 Tax=Salipaludibacillus keqinensis TaxID=2045207 RepID=A0A323TAP7_9BACI|nr:ABC transporter ATP-binding protein [Salipaludibacillus keqinensis]PYZ92431.1 multidrug ABC transporter ATP-binding protein [Salipaludibacillus keqinensis]